MPEQVVGDEPREPSDQARGDAPEHAREPHHRGIAAPADERTGGEGDEGAGRDGGDAHGGRELAPSIAEQDGGRGGRERSPDVGERLGDHRDPPSFGLARARLEGLDRIGLGR
ncbi:MAG TPA: hypothetical protein VFT80_14180 [Actinomycetota bacterium]|nr:hypothetical protein [Actinomycetota bacterium]